MIKELAKKALEDDYFVTLTTKLEKVVASRFFNRNETNDNLTAKEFNDLVRFADILSYSESEEGRNTSYRILSLLYEYNSDFDGFKPAFRAILIKLGNFPGITRLEKSIGGKILMPLERSYEEHVKKSLQKVPDSNLVFTDAQYTIFEQLKKNKHFSFSGPTSLGKSFIFESYIKDLIINEGVKDNMVILVPTRALINQCVQKLKNEFSGITHYEILAHPKIPEFIKSKGGNYIFVFTPERLISYISENKNPPIEYLFIDEAHKIISEKDTRNPLYYHSILQAQKRSIKLFFASPNISNPEVYLKLFERSTDEAIHTNESPVAQNKYFLDLNKSQIKVFGEFKNFDIEQADNFSFFDWLQKLSQGDNKSIVYCNSKVQTREYALNFSKLLGKKNDSRLDELINLIKESIHSDYYLIDCLQRGVAFHFGDLPQRIRVKVEELFKIGVIDYLFCTSTLLEGVNLPAKNIFVLSDKIGNSKFTKIDFLNLIGRAGRLTHEFSGNIIIVKEKGVKAWSSDGSLEKLIAKEKIPPLESQVIKGNKKFYENVLNTIDNKNLTRKSSTNYEEEILDHYANIALIHTIEETNSVLLGNLHKSKPESIESLQNKVKSNKVPLDILKISSGVKLEYQNNIIQGKKSELKILSANPTFQEIKDALRFLYEKYNWRDEESGRKQILKLAKPEKHMSILDYYSFLINSWIGSRPINMIIQEGIEYQHDRGLILYDELNQPLGVFNKFNQIHINVFINKLLEDIENLLRFRFIKYFNNYFMILKEIVGEQSAGSNWAEFLEYGSNNKKIIELQNIGLPRHIAYHINKNYPHTVTYDVNDNLIAFDPKTLLDSLGSKHTDVEKEIIEFYS